MNKKILTTIALSGLMLTGCGITDFNTIIKVNDKSITQGQYNDLFNKAAGNSMFAQMGLDIKKDKNNFLYLMIKDRVINELIVKTLVDQEMEKRHIKVTKKDTEQELKEIIDKIGSKEKFNEILKQNGISQSQFKQDLAEEVKMKKLVNMISKVNITESAAKKFYRENTVKFKYPDKVRASHILITANSDAIKEELKSKNKDLSTEELQKKVNEEMNNRLKRAEEILVKVKNNPQDFAKVAREMSEDTMSAKQGGDLGFFAQQEMVEPFSKAAFSMKPNTISNVVKTPYGYHIILVVDRMQAGQEPFDKVKSEIMTYLENQEQVKILENLIESLKKNAKIEYKNPEYNPNTLQDKLKEQAKSNPIINDEIEGKNRSATTP